MLIWGVLLFISGCLIADTARQYDDKTMPFIAIGHLTFCDLLKDWAKSDATCGHLVGATVSWQ